MSDVATILKYIICFCPQFALGMGLLNLALLGTLEWLDDTNYDVLDMRISGVSLVYMAICSVAYFVLLLILER